MHRPAAATIILLLPIANIRDLIRIDARGTTTALRLASYEFLKHAADCEQMAKFARDPQGKATRKRMAERWHRCAEKFTSESLAAHQAMAAKRRQGVAPDWAHH